MERKQFLPQDQDLAEKPREVQLRFLGYPKTNEFLQAAFGEEAHLRCPFGKDGKLVPSAKWATMVAIIQAYYGSDKNLEVVGKDFNIEKKQSVHQILKKGMEYLWQNCSIKLQESFPFSEIPLGKPSFKRGGVTLRVEKGLMQGKSIREIIQQEKEKLTGTQLSSTRRVLAKLGIEVPYLAPSRRKIDLEIPELGRRKDVLFYRKHRDLFVTVKEVVKEGGFHVRPSDLKHFTQRLKEEGIPLVVLAFQIKSGKYLGRWQRYYFISREDFGRAVAAIRGDSDLAKFLAPRVKQICGPKVALPNTTLLSKKTHYESVAKLFAPLGVRPGGHAGPRYKEFFADCPVPIFNRDHHHLYPLDQKELLSRFIEERLGRGENLAS